MILPSPIIAYALGTFALAAAPSLLAADDVTVITVRASAKSLSREVRLPSTVLAYEEATLVAHLTGYVREVAVREGDRVALGDVLATIEVPVMSEDLARAQAAVDVARAMVSAEQANVAAMESAVAMHEAARARSTTEKAWRDVQLARVQTLHDEGASTAEELEDAQGAVNVAVAKIAEEVAAIASARASVTTASARVRGAEAGVAAAQADLARTEAMGALAVIRCPFPKALVSMRHVDPGSLVEADDTPLLHVMNVEKVRVRFDLDERDAVHIQPGAAVTLTPDAKSVAPRQATVTRISGAIDPMTRRMQIEVDLDNTDQQLRPGMFLHANVQVFQRPGALVLPARCLRFSGEDVYVWTVGGGALVKKIVTTGVDDGLEVEIATGLKVGDEVVFSGPENLAEGQKVQTQSREGG